MDPHRIIDPFFRSLAKVVHEKLEHRITELLHGGALDFAGYKEQIGYIRALQEVLQWGEDLERDQYGRKPEGD
jgi:hypothetical protein